MLRTSVAGLCLLLLPAAASAAEMATAQLKAPDGKSRGSVELRQTPHGVLIKATLQGLPPGAHGFHIHETGKCSPNFTAAGGHYAPAENPHGFLREAGPHVGDMPNIHVPESGELTVEVLNPRASLLPDAPTTLFDEDGSAIVVHSKADDYTSQPTGDAGDRIACGVVERS